MIFRVLSGLFAVLFVYAAAVQYNDPDPVIWILIYGLAAIVSAAAALGRRMFWPSVFVGAVAVVWALTLVPAVLAQPPSMNQLTEYRMLNVAVEEAREMLGLFIVAAWMAVVAMKHRPARAVTAAV